MSVGKVIAIDSVYIDPIDCDSQVSYKIIENVFTSKSDNVEKSVSATILISDCNRRIDWYFAADQSDLDKIDTAIRVLNDFRKLLAVEVKKKATKKTPSQ